MLPSRILTTAISTSKSHALLTYAMVKARQSYPRPSMDKCLLTQPPSGSGPISNCHYSPAGKTGGPRSTAISLNPKHGISICARTGSSASGSQPYCPITTAGIILLMQLRGLVCPTIPWDTVDIETNALRFLLLLLLSNGMILRVPRSWFHTQIVIAAVGRFCHHHRTCLNHQVDDMLHELM